MEVDHVHVKISADASELRTGVTAAADAVARSTKHMRDSMEAVRQKAQQAQKTATESFRRMADDLKGLVAAYAGLESIKAMARIADEASLARARIQGVTGSTQATVQAQQQLYELSQRLQSSYQESLSTFARIMPAVKELKGGVTEATRLTEILITTAKMSGASSAEASASAMQFAQALGSGTLQGDELRSILEGNQTLARELASALGVSIGELRKMGSEGKLTSEVVANALLGSYDKIKNSAADLPATVGGAWTQVQNAFTKFIEATESKTGAFAYIARLLSELAKVIEIVAARFNVTKDASDKLGQNNGAQTFARAVGTAFAYALDVGGAVINSFTSIGKIIGAVAAAVMAVASGNFKGAAEIIKDAGHEYAEAWKGAYKAIKGDGGNLQAYQAMLMGEGASSREGRGATEGASAKLQGKKGKDEGTKGIAAQLEAELEATRVAIAQRNAINREGRRLETEDEAAFWELALQRTDLTEKDRAAIRKKAAEANLRMLQEGFDRELMQLKAEEQAAEANAQAKLQIVEKEAQQIAGWYGVNSKEYAAAERRRVDATREAEQQIRAIKLQAENSRREQAAAIIDGAALEARTQYELGVITHQQLLALERQFEEQRKAIRQQALQDELAATSPDKDPVRYAQLTAQIEQLEREHVLRMAQIRSEIAKDEAGNNPFLNMAQGAVDGVGQMVDGVLGKFQSLRQTAAGVFRSMYANFVSEMVTKPLQQMMMRYLRETILYKLMGQQQSAAQAASSQEIMSKKAQEAFAVVGANAAEAGSGAASSVASIPYVGPILAAAAFASVFAMVMGAKGSIRSARNGFDIPAGLNPVTQLHEREMVLPQEQADAVRDMASGRGAPVYIQGQPDDTIKLRDLAGVLKKLGRDFAFV
ncbi:MAG: tape measure protein [Pseudomonadota bacterium]